MIDADNTLYSYVNFLIYGLHFSKKYNLKFQCRLYKELIDTYCYKNNVKIEQNLYSNDHYLKYNDLEKLFKYTKIKCKEDNCKNILKYGYIYCCYKLRKVKRINLVLMLLDKDFLKYSCYNSVFDSYEKKDIKIYTNSFYDVKNIPGYSAGYYLLGKIYEKEAKNEWLNDTKKKKLIDISFYCYYLCFKACPFYICSLKKLLALHGIFYYSSMYMDEIKKIAKLYNFTIDIYKKWKCEIIKNEKSGEESELELELESDLDEYKTELQQQEMLKKKRNTYFDNNILELVDLMYIKNNIYIENKEFILSLINVDLINSFFLDWIYQFKINIKKCMDIENKRSCMTKIGLHDLVTISKIYYYFYLNNFNKCLLLIEKYENEPIFSVCFFYLKGLCYFLLRNYKKTIFYFEQINDIDCYYTKHLPVLSTCYWYENNIKKVEYILTFYPKKEINEYFLCLIGNYFSLKNKKTLACYFFKQAIMLNTFYEYSYILYSCEIQYIGQMKKAVLALLKCLQINPCNFKAHLLLSVILYKERMYELSNVHVSLCLKLNHNDTLICLYCASLYNHNKKYETALLCLEHALKNNSQCTEVLIMQGIMFLKIKSNIEALNSFLKAQKIYPDSNYINTLVAITLVLEQKYNKSKRIIKEIIYNNTHNINKNLLKYIYNCCNLKIAPNECIINKIERFFKQENFYDNIEAYENACSQR
ncbi:anaphase promoting complex subunit, putative [Hepatocystis sp. ex Piliocolobus tephrosceles]|nr:anaphase promoting complex subunit, putative [Hepatocystis sp. ex Piliocolobus tephrosceles]